MNKERFKDIHEYIEELIKTNNELHKKLVESEKKREIGKRNFKAFIVRSKKRGTKILELEKENIELKELVRNKFAITREVIKESENEELEIYKKCNKKLEKEVERSNGLCLKNSIDKLGDNVEEIVRLRKSLKIQNKYSEKLLVWGRRYQKAYFRNCNFLLMSLIGYLLSYVVFYLIGR